MESGSEGDRHTETPVATSRSIGVAIQPAEGGGYVFHAVEGEDSRQTWFGIIQAPTAEVALIDLFSQLKAEAAAQDRIRFVIDLPRGNMLWKHNDELRLALPGCLIQGPAEDDAMLIGAARKGLPLEWEAVRISSAELLLLKPLIVATDGSVRGGHTGYGWLASDGQYGLHGSAHTKKAIGPEVALVAELRAIDDAVRMLPHRQLTVLSDSKLAITMVSRWMDGDDVLPEGYTTTNRPRGQMAGLVKAQNRMRFQRDRLSFHWVQGHNGQLLNEGADALARLASRFAKGGSDLSPSEYRERAKSLAKGFARAFRDLDD